MCTPNCGNRYSSLVEEERYVGIGDRVLYIDSFNPDVNGIEVVGVDGTIAVPPVGAVAVAGLTRAEVEALLTQRISPYFERNDVKVTIEASTEGVYFVLSEVPDPGLRPFEGDLTLFEAVVRELPDDFSGDLGRVKLIRADPRDPSVLTASVSEMIQSCCTFSVLIEERDVIVLLREGDELHEPTGAPMGGGRS